MTVPFAFAASSSNGPHLASDIVAGGWVMTGSTSPPAVRMLNQYASGSLATVSDTFAKKDIATIIGIGGMAGLVGGILFPWFSGWLLDRLPATQGYTILFAICASANLVAFAIHHALCPRLDPLPEKAAPGA